MSIFSNQKYLLIDGENTRKILGNFLSSKKDFLNFDLYKILQNILPNTKFDKIIWYGAKIVGDKNTEVKSGELIDFQRRLFSVLQKQNIEINLSGRIQNFDGVYKEKGVDVAIAVDMIDFGLTDKTIEIYLWSNDSDLVPAIKRLRLKKIKVNYIAAHDNITKSILFNCNKTFILVKESIKKSFANKNPNGV